MVQKIGEIMLKTTEVFTPNTSSPRLSKVSRVALEEHLADKVDEGGMYIFVQGVTKLGKTTLVRGAVKELDSHFWFDAQNLREGTAALWSALASQLRHPIEEAMKSTNTDTSKWSFLGSLGFPGITVGTRAGGSHASGWEKSRIITNDLPHAIPAALAALRESGKSAAIVLDDFHFIDDQEVRTQILQALKPVADKGVTIIVVTLPYRDNFQAFTTSNIGGRSAVLEIPTWTEEELSEIAETGFAQLSVWAENADISLLAANSFGSPQIMQNLCLQLCRQINQIRQAQSALTKLELPSDSERLFKLVSDQNALNWLKHLGRGLNTRGKKRRIYSIKDDGQKMGLDGYTLVLHALRKLGPQPRTPLAVLKAELAKLREVDISVISRMNLSQILTPMSLLALNDMQAKLKEVDEAQEHLEADDIFADSQRLEVPQPVFEWSDQEGAKPINILDPLLLFTLRWHWPDVLEALKSERGDSEVVAVP